MEEPFDLPVTYKGDEVSFPTQLIQSGYNHRFAMDVYGTVVYFEPDEEKTYRAIIEEDSPNKKINVELLEAISKAIQKVLE